MQRGQYAKDVVDYCIDCIANAVGVNLTIVHKESSDVYSLMQQHKCTKFSSKYNITLVYSTNKQSKKRPRCVLQLLSGCYILQEKVYFSICANFLLNVFLKI